MKKYFNTIIKAMDFIGELNTDYKERTCICSDIYNGN